MRNQSLINPNDPEVTIRFWSVFLQTLIPIRTEQFTNTAFLLFSSFSSQGTAEKGFPVPLPLPGGFLMRRQDKNKGALRVTAPLGNSSRGSYGLLSAMQPAPTRHQLQEGQSPLPTAVPATPNTSHDSTQTFLAAQQHLGEQGMARNSLLVNQPGNILLQQSTQGTLRARNVATVAQRATYSTHNDME